MVSYITQDQRDIFLNLVLGCVISTWILNEYLFLSDHLICEKIQRDQTVTGTEKVTQTE